MPDSLMTTDAPPSTCLHPKDADSLWRLVNAPHPLVGNAHHLGEALVQAGLVTPAALLRSLQIQQQERECGQHRPVGQILVAQGDLTQERLRQVIGSWLGGYMVDPSELPPPTPPRWRWCRAPWPSANPCCPCWRARTRWWC